MNKFNKSFFLKNLKEKAFVLDGAMGTMLQKEGFTKGCPDELNIKNPELVRRIHKKYAEAGSSLIITNTFGANRLRLGKYGLEKKVKEINEAAVRNARESCPGCFVVGDVGPLEDFIEPLGKLGFDEAYSVYKEQISALKGADILIIETISDIMVLKAALIAAKDSFDGAIISSITIQDGRTSTGTNAETYAAIAEALGADIIGVNCSDGPEGMYETAKIILANTDKAVCLQPNAGLPKIVNGETVWDYPIEQFADYAERFVKLGANIIGGCCGTSPDFIKAVAERIGPLRPGSRRGLMPGTSERDSWNKGYNRDEGGREKKGYSERGYSEKRYSERGYSKGRYSEKRYSKKRKSCEKNAGEENEPDRAKESNKKKTRLCSRTKTVVVEPTLIVGERINPTNRAEFINDIRKGKTDYIRNQALQQVSEGASLLDINVGVAGGNEIDYLPKAVSVVQNIVDAPLVIDTSDAKALEEALKKCDGKPLINSVNGSEKSMKEVLPLVKRYGAAVIALCLDDSGIPSTKEKRIEIAKRIIQRALRLGIEKEDIIVDPLVLTIATNPENEGIVLNAVKEIKALGYKTILGISNISYGLPNRSEVNSKFYTKAHNEGLDLAILNPLDNILREETDIKIKLRKFSREDYKKFPVEKQLYNAVLYGDKDNIAEIVGKGLGKLKAAGINDILIDALNEVGEKFSRKDYFLPNVLMSAEAMKMALAVLKKGFKEAGRKENGIVLFATVENDIHDIGKNIVIALLESYNYRIIDLGVNVRAGRIISEAKKQKPDIIALSALMTTTVMGMEHIINELRKQGINTPVIIGGAVVTNDYASQIKAAYGKDALSAVRVISGMIKKRINREKDK